MKTIRTQAIVLRRTNYGETDRILQLLTPDGRYGAMARGVRKEKSKLAGGIELFAVSDIVLTQGKGELMILTSARLRQFYRGIMADYDKLQFAYHVIEHVTRGSEGVDTAEWYELAHDTLAALDTHVSIALVKLWFYVRIAALHGTALSVERDYRGDVLTPDVRYRYDVHEQGFIPDVQGIVTENHIKTLRLASTQTLTVLAKIGGMEQYLDECLDVAWRHASLE